MPSTITGMVLDGWQQIWLTLTISIDKKVIQKPSFLDVSTINTPFAQPILDNSGIFNDDYHEDVIPTNLTVPLPPNLTALSPIEGTIAGVMAKHKKSSN